MKRIKKKSDSKTSRAKATAQTPGAPRRRLATERRPPFFLLDDESWLIFMEPVLGENPAAAESLARLFQTLKESMESGPEGVARAYFTLIDGICKAYEYTEAHREGLRLYNLYLAGKLRVEDEPLPLITAAIARVIPEEG